MTINRALHPVSKVVRHRPNERTVGRKSQSIFILCLISLSLLGAIGSRLAYLQLVDGEKNLTRAEGNRIRTILKQPVRGTIFDRNGEVLTSSRLSHSVFVWPLATQKEYWPATLARLSKILNIPEEEITQRIERAKNSPSTLMRIARSLTPTEITALKEYAHELQGAEVDIEQVRHYPNKQLGAHILGYTGEISQEAYQRKKDQGYRPGEIVGQMGVEAAFEDRLRGEWGGKEFEVNGAGKVIRILGEKDARAGKNVNLTLDLNVQRAAEAALGNRKGAIVAIDPRNGEVLAMTSRPTFDPNIFSSRITPQQWNSLQQTKPFVNRAIRAFPPASTFKVVTATAGLESGKYQPGTVLGTFAYLSVGNVRFHEWNKAGFGPMGFERAMAMSSNTFFGQIGRGVGGEALIEWSRKYGFGSKTGIELGGESGGLIADDGWKRKNFGDWGWTVGDTINMSIGQGFTNATPLQVAVMFAVPANGGYRVTPHLLKDGQNEEKWRESLNIKPQNLASIRRGLRQVITNGTGRAATSPGLPPVAGKSGTAEAPPGDPHAWFGAYAPYDNPEIVVVAFVEHQKGGGGKIAAPLVRQVMEAYFNGSDSKEEKDNQ